MTISNDTVSAKIYDKCDDFDLEIVNFQFLDDSDPVLSDWSLTEIQSYVVEALFECYFKVLQPIKLILNIHEIITGYFWYAKLKYYELQ